MSSVDLHIHSSISSNGEFSPSEIIEMARNNSVSMLSITDHNSVRGVQKAVRSCDLTDITLIPDIKSQPTVHRRQATG